MSCQSLPLSIYKYDICLLFPWSDFPQPIQSALDTAHEISLPELSSDRAGNLARNDSSAIEWRRYGMQCIKLSLTVC
jgi:hypothetical protein